MLKLNSKFSKKNLVVRIEITVYPVLTILQQKYKLSVSIMFILYVTVDIANNAQINKSHTACVRRKPKHTCWSEGINATKIANLNWTSQEFNIKKILSILIITFIGHKSIDIGLTTAMSDILNAFFFNRVIIQFIIMSNYKFFFSKILLQ